MTVQVYRSTDVSAPVLNGTVGSLISLLDAILVDGYGAKTALGWTKAFTGTNVASYRMGVGTNQMYLDVDDTNVGSANDYYAKVRGYETMSAVATGTGPFPTTIQAASFYWVKSQESASSTAVTWVAIGTNKMFYLWVKPVSSSTIAPNGDYGFVVGFFGDFTSFKSGDAYNTIIFGQTTRTTMQSNCASAVLTTQINGVCTGHYIARSFTQAGTAMQVGKHSDNAKLNGLTVIGQDGLPYPNSADGGLYLAPIWIHEPDTLSLRGVLPGMWCPLHKKPLVTYDQFTGTGNLAGKTFMALTTNGLSNYGQFFFEISNTW